MLVQFEIGCVKYLVRIVSCPCSSCSLALQLLVHQKVEITGGLLCIVTKKKKKKKKKKCHVIGKWINLIKFIPLEKIAKPQKVYCYCT